MDDRSLRLLEFPRVRALLEERAATQYGREVCAALAPVSDFVEVEHRQAETSEARFASSGGKNPPLGGIRDLREPVGRAMRGGVLGAEELLDVADTARAALRMKKFLDGVKQDCPILAAHGGRIAYFGALEDEIRAAITDEAQVSDGASPALGRIRRQIKVFHARVREKLENLVRSASARYLQEPIITIREDRYVVPVKQEFRSQVPGIVHDQSASGQTLFIEPLAVVELNNDLKKLALEEKAEVERILAALSALVGQEGPAFLETLSALAHLDFCFAKARLSADMDAVRPEVNRDGWLEIRRGRHPLLKGEVVPVDVHLGKTFDTLVITGPNTGGKTVTLKTVGLFSLMAMAGLHVPARLGTALCIWENVFADIGDEQSIEQSLSTFSSHMSAIVRILEALEGPSLVLLDELGAGTDPTEGAALAMSILEHLHAKKARTIATTHYSELKTFAYTRPRVENASVEFDLETLRPTYRLQVGLPGASQAFEISRRLGLSQGIVDRARSFLTREEEKVETLIRQMQAAKAQMESDRQAANVARAEALELKQRHDQLLKDLRKKEHELLDRARAEANALVQQARREMEEIIKELRAAQRQVQRAEQEQVLKEARQRLSRVQQAVQELVEEAPPPEPGEGPRGLKVGEAVRIRSIAAAATVLAPPDAQGNVLVQAGIMRVSVPLHDLERGEALARRPEATAVRQMASQKAQTISPDLDLRGLTVEEALESVDKYLDDAALAGLSSVRIIHGKGTGALRQAVREYLRGHRHVTSFRLGHMNEGGDGVTVATLGE